MERWTSDFWPRRGSVALETRPGETVVAIRVEGRLPPAVEPWLLLDGTPLFRLPVGSVWDCGPMVLNPALVHGGAWSVQLVPGAPELDQRWVVRFRVRAGVAVA